MQRNYIHDIKPSKQVQRRRAAFHRAHDKRVHELEESFTPAPPKYASSRRSSSGRGVWYVALFVILLLVLALTFVFAGATVYVTPRTGTVEISGPILAEKESNTGLSFEMLSLSDEKSIEVSAGEKTYVERRAEGRVTLYNNNESSQKLLIDTRLESPDGYIYKTKIATEIPGKSGNNPGSIEVDVYADEAGDVYNIDKDTDLKVVGFRGSPKYETVYAKSLTDIEGGFKGDSYAIGEESLENHKVSLRDDLRMTLLEKAKAELPKEFVMYEMTAMIDFDDVVVADSGTEGMATITQKGTLNAVIFNEQELTDSLVEKVVADVKENRVFIPNIEDLNITLAEGSSVSNPETINDVEILINDKVDVIWSVDKDSIKEALLSVKKRDFQNTMLQFKNIDKAELDLRPFWKATLPDKIKAIKVVNSLDQLTQ